MMAVNKPVGRHILNKKVWGFYMLPPAQVAEELCGDHCGIFLYVVTIPPSPRRFGYRVGTFTASASPLKVRFFCGLWRI